jgi:hypothetical protein
MAVLAITAAQEEYVSTDEQNALSQIFSALSMLQCWSRIGGAELFPDRLSTSGVYGCHHIDYVS